MACINPDGTITKPARATLNAMKDTATGEEIARTTGFPLYRVRSVLRELVDTGLAALQDGRYTLTDLGLQKLDA